MKIRVGDRTISKDPDLRLFLKDAEITDPNRVKRILLSFQKEGIEVNQLHSLDINQLVEMGMSRVIARKIYQHARLIRLGQPVLMSMTQVKEIESRYDYLQSTSSDINRMLTYANGRTGIRSATLTEIYGEASSGKTQWCYTLAIMCMREWKRSVIYVDSEGSFDLTRFLYMARYWGLTENIVNERLRMARVSSFDDVEDAIHAAANSIEGVGMIIIDSIMDPLKSQYQISGDDLKNLQPRQAHLKRVTDQLKSIAQINNLICIYTNHIRASFGEDNDGTVAQGGNVLSHASDIRIELQLVKDKGLDNTGLKLARAIIVDSGFLPNASGEYLIGPMGMADPAERDRMIKHAKIIQERGFICVDSRGEEIEPLVKAHGKRDKSLQEMKKELYNVN